MKFIVTGADKKTGRDANLAITAASAEEAERLATKQGLLVASVKTMATPASGGKGTDVGTGALPVWGDDPADAAAATVASPGAGSAKSASPPQATRQGVSLANPPSPTPSAPPPPTNAAGGEGTSRDSAVPASATYHVIQNPALYLLEAAVNKHMKEGWEPLGGIQVSYATNQLVFYQGLVRKRPGE